MADQVYSNRPKTAHVKVKGNGMNIDLMLKIFKRKVKESGILEEYKRRTEFIKPSEKKKDKMNASRKRQRKLDREQE
jgi:small subunit ribosomal protein S21